MNEREKIAMMLTSAVEEERLQALRVMTSQEGDVLFPVLYRAFGDESWRVRKEAAAIFLSISSAGKQVGKIVGLLHSQENAGLRNTAVEILVRLGRQAVPSLLAELSCSEADVRKFVLDILGAIGDPRSVPSMIDALHDADSNVRAAAAENLGRIGAAEAVPALLDAMAEPDILFRYTILEALGQIGASVPVSRLLEYGEENLLKKALFDCLGRVGGKEALPTLVKGLSARMTNVRDAALLAINQLGHMFRDEAVAALATGGTEAGDAVAALMESPDQQIRQVAVRILGLLGDGRFVSRLLTVLDSEDLRDAAVESLVAIARRDPDEFVRAWEPADPRSRIYIAYLLGETEGSDAVRTLLRSALTASDPELRLMAARALGNLGDLAALPQLVSSLAGNSEDVRETAVNALIALGGRHREEALSALEPLVDHPDPLLRMCRVMILGRLDGPDVERSLAFAMKDESPLVRRAAVRAIEGQKGDEQLQNLMLALTDEDNEVRRLAAEVLGLSGNRQALAPLELALRDDDLWVRAAAVRALGHFDSDDVVELISKGLGDPVGLVCIAALETLVEADADKAYAPLVQSLEHPDAEVVNAAIKLLVGLGRREWLSEAAERLLAHRHWEVRITAARALAELEGGECRARLGRLLASEEEELVRQQLRGLMASLDAMQE